MDYLRWSKVHNRVRYELTGSGVAPATLEDLDTTVSPISLDVQGTYGDPRLIDAITRRYALPDDRILPVAGASSGIFIAVAAAVEHGSTVIVEQPVYEPIRRAAAFRHLRVLSLHRRPQDRFDIDIARIEEGLGQGARAVVLTNLHNPSGQLLSQAAVTAIAQRCDRVGATLIIDEVYLDAAHLNIGGPLWTAANVADNVIAINSLTKVYGLSGLRIGWLMTNPTLLDRARLIMDMLNVDNPAPSTALALNAIEQIDRLEERFRRFYRQGQELFRRWLASEPDFRGYESCGSIFECVRLPAGMRSVDFNDHLVSRFDTQVVPGRFFGLDDHIRLGLTLPPDDLREALHRISRARREFTLENAATP